MGQRRYKLLRLPAVKSTAEQRTKLCRKETFPDRFDKVQAANDRVQRDLSTKFVRALTAGLRSMLRLHLHRCGDLHRL